MGGGGGVRITGASGAGNAETDDAAERVRVIGCIGGSEYGAVERKGSKRCGAGGVRAGGAAGDDGVVSVGGCGDDPMSDSPPCNSGSSSRVADVGT